MRIDKNILKLDKQIEALQNERRKLEEYQLKKTSIATELNELMQKHAIDKLQLHEIFVDELGIKIPAKTKSLKQGRIPAAANA